jgi:hypothetical protein
MKTCLNPQAYACAHVNELQERMREGRLMQCSGFRIADEPELISARTPRNVS